jgi:hypothetical protein
VSIIWPCPLTPSSYAADGRAIEVPTQVCPDCQEPLTGWGGYWRWVHSAEAGEQRVWIRRGWCTRCRRSQALLPSFVFVRRLYEGRVIGSALERAAEGCGARTVARQVAVPHTTVRDWWRRVKTKAPELLASLLVLATRLDPAPMDLRMEGAAAVVEAVANSWRRAWQHLASRTPDQWAFWSLISGGLALAPHTSPPLPG